MTSEMVPKVLDFVHFGGEPCRAVWPGTLPLALLKGEILYFTHDVGP